MARAGDQWKCERCSSTRKHTQVEILSWLRSFISWRKREKPSECLFLVKLYVCWVSSIYSIISWLQRLLKWWLELLPCQERRWLFFQDAINRRYISHHSNKCKSNRRSLVTIAVPLLSCANAWPGCTTWWNSLSEGSLCQNRLTFWFICGLCTILVGKHSLFPSIIATDSLSLSSFGAPWEWFVETTEFLHRYLFWCQILSLLWCSKVKWKWKFSCSYRKL